MAHRLKIFIAVLIVVVAGVFIYNHNKTTKKDQQSGTNQVVQVGLAPSGIKYPSTWQEAAKVSLTDKKSGVISESFRNNPSTKVILREMPVKLTDKFDINKLPDQVVTSLQSEIDGFKLTSKGVVKIGSYEAAKIEYTAPNADQKDYKNTMYIVPTAKKAFYITYQTTENLSDIKADVDAINTSIAFDYIKSHL